MGACSTSEATTASTTTRDIKKPPNQRRHQWHIDGKVAELEQHDVDVACNTSHAAITNVENCVKVLEKALEGMEPPLEVYRCVLRLIAVIGKGDTCTMNG